MKRAIILLALCLFVLAGCTELEEPALTASVRLVGNEGVIYAPLINGMPFGYDANVQPGDLIRMDFNPDRDQYGNKTGLSSNRYTLAKVTAECDLKTEPDTIFPMANRNIPIWFPGYTAPLEAISGLPVPFYPLEGYPWDACRTCGIPEMRSQQATITATARAESIEVEFVMPEQGGTYILNLPGQSATNSTRIKINIASHGAYTVTHSSGKVYEFVVPIDWFFIEGSWRIDVGPTGVC